MEASQSAKAREKREEILARGKSASEIQTALLELEDALEAAAKASLAGNASAEPAPAVAGVSNRKSGR